MPSSTKIVGTGANDAGAGGSRAWSSTSNITADDGASATAGTAGEEDATQTLLATMAGNVFAVPGGATIEGVEVSVDRRDAAGFSGALIDSSVQLVKGGVVSGDDKSAGEAWPESFEVKTFGGAADLWGLSLTAEDVNASNFGVALRGYCAAGTVEPRVDYVSITVYYTGGATGAASATVMLMGGD